MAGMNLVLYSPEEFSRSIFIDVGTFLLVAL